MTSIEMTKILSKPWASVTDIRKIANCGRDKASIIRDDICNDILTNGKKLPICKQKIVPMDKVIDYLNINVEYIYSMAKKEKTLL